MEAGCLSLGPLTGSAETWTGGWDSAGTSSADGTGPVDEPRLTQALLGLCCRPPGSQNSPPISSGRLEHHPSGVLMFPHF